MEANERQVGGGHYKSSSQHWDWVAANQLDYFQGQVTKYVARWKDKNGLQDLLKAQHFLEKYIELVKAGVYRQNAHNQARGAALSSGDWARQATLGEISGAAPTAGYTNQDR